MQLEFNALNSLHSPGHPSVVPPRNAAADPENRKRLIDQAKDEIPLSSEAWLCANDVRDAGNCAVHRKRYKEFLQPCEGDKIGRIVANTLKVLQELCRREETR